MRNTPIDRNICHLYLTPIRCIKFDLPPVIFFSFLLLMPRFFKETKARIFIPKENWTGKVKLKINKYSWFKIFVLGNFFNDLAIDSISIYKKSNLEQCSKKENSNKYFCDKKDYK